jgi:hypothetical protein
MPEMGEGGGDFHSHQDPRSKMPGPSLQVPGSVVYVEHVDAR